MKKALANCNVCETRKYHIAIVSSAMEQIIKDLLNRVDLLNGVYKEFICVFGNDNNAMQDQKRIHWMGKIR